MEAESALEWETLCPGGARYSEDWLGEAPLIAEGNEHRIFQSEDGSRAIKLTRPPNFGAMGCLADYLDNFVLNNHLWGDDLRLEGIQTTTAGLQLIVSQPWIRGAPATEEEIRSFLAGKGFAPCGTNAFRNSHTGIRLADARPANIFKDHLTGLLMPVDVHVRAPEGVLTLAWEEQQRRENG